MRPQRICDSLILCAVYKCSYLLTYLLTIIAMQWLELRRRVARKSHGSRATVESQSQLYNQHRLMRWLQLRFDFDSTAVRLLIKGHFSTNGLYRAIGVWKISNNWQTHNKTL